MRSQDTSNLSRNHEFSLVLRVKGPASLFCGRHQFSKFEAAVMVELESLKCGTQEFLEQTFLKLFRYGVLTALRFGELSDYN